MECAISSSFFSFKLSAMFGLCGSGLRLGARLWLDVRLRAGGALLRSLSLDSLSSELSSLTNVHWLYFLRFRFRTGRFSSADSLAILHI
jgi:hypothetical protein